MVTSLPRICPPFVYLNFSLLQSLSLGPEELRLWARCLGSNPGLVTPQVCVLDLLEPGFSVGQMETPASTLKYCLGGVVQSISVCPYLGLSFAIRQMDVVD